MSKKRKIMLVYSTAGMGHKKAALALEALMKGLYGQYEIKAVDIMEHATKFYKFLYLDFYVFMMKRATWLWAFMFYLSDMHIFDLLTRKLRARMDFKGIPGFEELLRREAPDAVVATHFLVPSVVNILKKKGIKAKFFAVVTDYGPHSYWVSNGVDRYFVGSEWVRMELVRKGISADRVDVTGIPTTKEFHEKHDINLLVEKYQLDKHRKTIFIMSGGFGVGPVGKMLTAMNVCEVDIQVIAVCGHNKSLYSELQALSSRLKYPLKLFGFTDRVAELMALSEMMITKAGGISVTEAMDSQLPMILYGSIPGQESWNESYLTGSSAAIIARSINEIPSIVDRVLGDDKEYESLKKGLSKARKPEAAQDISRIAVLSIGG